MTDQLRSLDLLEPPEQWSDIERRTPRVTPSAQPSIAKRLAIIAAAAVIAVAGVGFAIDAFSGSHRHRGGAAIPPPSSHPTASPPAGQLIAFTDANVRIATMHPDGSGFHQITTGSEPDPYAARYGGSQDLDPAWSPDGRTIYFERRYTESVYSFCSISARGGDFEVIVRNFGAGDFALSPSGARVAFASSGGIHVMNVDGSRDHLVVPVTGLAYGIEPSWSPDGTRIAFIRFEHADQLLVGDLGTGNFEVVTTERSGIAGVAWSPDGSQIAYGVRSRSSDQVWLVGPDGSDNHQLTSSPGSWDPLAWSSDGSQLLLGRLGPRFTDHGLAVIGADGSDLNVIRANSLSGFGSWRA